MYKNLKEETSNAEFCPFCKELAAGQFLRRYEKFFLIANIFPYEENHLLLLPIRHINSELDFDRDEQKDLEKIHRRILESFYKNFEMCFYFTRENTPNQSRWHWHRHYVPTDNVLLTGVRRVEYTGVTINLD